MHGFKLYNIHELAGDVTHLLTGDNKLLSSTYQLMDYTYHDCLQECMIIAYIIDHTTRNPSMDYEVG